MIGTLDTDAAILLDVGSAWAKATVVGRVQGRWRVIGHASQPTAWGGAELQRSLAARLAGSADPRLVGHLEQVISRAPRLECHTPTRPARLALVGVSRELSAAAARRGAESAGWEIAVATTLDDGAALAERLERLESAEVDAWLIAGGFDGARSQRALEAAALVSAARAEGGGPVIWAGANDLADDVAALFEDGAVHAVANPRPDPRREEPGPLRTHLEELLRETAGADGSRRLAPVAFRRAIAELARQSGLRTLGIDVGAHATTRIRAEPNGTDESRTFADGGVGGTSLTAPSGPGRVARALAASVDELTAADLLHALRVQSGGVPQTSDELAVAHAAARAQLSATNDDDGLVAVDLVVGAGSTIAAAPNAVDAAHILLDGLRPVGVTQLAIDSAAVLAPIGSLADDEIEEGIALLGDDLVSVLGTAVVTRGGEPGRPAMRVTVHRAGWPS
jgi:MutL protein